MTKAKANARSPSPVREVSLPTGGLEKDIDQIFSEMGFGLWQMSLIAVLCVGAAADSMEMALLSFISPCVAKAWDLSDDKESLISSIAFVGELVGAMTFGSIADLKGRRFSFSLCVMLIIIGGVLTFFTVDYIQLLCCRFTVGIGVGGTVVAWDYVSETMPPESRGKCMVVVAFSSAIATVGVSALAWAILDEYGWHLLALLCALPSIFVLLMLFTITESPRYLLSQGKYEECRKAIEYGAKLNGKDLGEYTIKPMAVAHKKGQFWEIFKGSLRNPTFRLGVNWTFESFTAYSTSYLTALLLLDSGVECEYNYEDILISALAPPFFLVLTFSFVDKTRTVTMVVAFFAAAFFLLFFGVGFDDTTLTIFAFGARGSGSTGVCMLWIITPEFYPTEIRASAHSFFYTFARIGSFASSYWVYCGLDTELICGLVALFCIVMGVNSFFIEETAGLYLNDNQGATPDRPQIKRKRFSKLTRKSNHSSRPDNEVSLI
mmetsp:Transcript_11408/g.14859  ORF Transcript_11408/g.14859 Transcript_11408/m.14859 type:complete len:491 (-) Transcript_11408:471-1943(-)